VRLVGPAANPDGLGAVLRPVNQGRAGAAVAVGVGSYGSPAGGVTVLGGPVEAVQVRWPDGRRSDLSVPAGAGELTVRHGGN
jgi:hypothetical protein